MPIFARDKMLSDHNKMHFGLQYSQSQSPQLPAHSNLAHDNLWSLEIR